MSRCYGKLQAAKQPGFSDAPIIALSETTEDALIEKIEATAVLQQ